MNDEEKMKSYLQHYEELDDSNYQNDNSEIIPDNKPNNVRNNYYENLKSESYRAMLDSEIQAGIARDQAMKYTQNQMNAMGYGSQGLAQSSMVGIQNNYRNALSEAAKTYQSSVNEINNEELSAGITNDNDVFKSASALMSGATSQETLDKIYDTYKNDTSLNENSRKQLELLHSMYSENFNSDEMANVPQFSFDNGEFTYYENGVAKTESMGSDFKHEMNTLKASINTNSIPNGAYIHLINDDNGNTLEDYEKSNKKDAEHVYLKYVNGNLYYVSNKDYEDNATNDNAYVIIEKNALQQKKVI